MTLIAPDLPVPECLDPGIRPYVEALMDQGVETFESCESGEGHCFAEPTIRFHGQREEGFRALAAALEVGLPVAAIRRVWRIIDGEPTGPDWEMTFWRAAPVEHPGPSQHEPTDAGANPDRQVGEGVSGRG